MTERGEYRAIRRVLLDGPDYQRLPERARHVFLVLKLNFGPAGLEVWYHAELVARLSAQTGISAGGVQEALIALEAAGWVERESNVVWLIGQLDNDPHVKPADRKHRTMVQRHVAGLPRLAIVSRFVLAHPQWFTLDGSPSGDPYEPLRWAFEGPSMGLRSTKNETEDKTENETDSLGSSGDDPTGSVATPTSDYPADFEATWAIYPKRSGGNSKKEAYAKWKARLRAGVTAEVLHAGVERYRRFCDHEAKTGSQFVKTAAVFFGPGEHYLEPWTLPGAAASRPRLVTANPTEEADRRHRAEVAQEERYAAARRRAIAEWAAAHPTEHAEFAARVDRRYAGRQGEWIAPARDAELEQLCGHAAAFPPFEQWQRTQTTHHASVA